MAANRGRDPRLHGRDDACETLAGLVGGAHHGHGAVLAVRGEAGTGKTALLDHTVGRARDLRVIRATGAAAETGLPHAGLHQLCGPLLGLLPRLPDPQRAALETVFGLRAGAADRFLVNLAVLGLLSRAAAETPLLCVLDDAHWLDPASAQALAFVARRLSAEPVVLLLAARAPVAVLAGLPELVIGDLGDTDARDLLATAVRWPLDDRVRDQIVAETRGNPRMLLELRDLSPAELAGGFGPPGSGSSPEAPARLLALLAELPAPARTVLLAAAADPTGDPALLRRASQHLGLTGDAIAPAVEAGLIAVAGRVRFRDRQVRAAAYRAGPLRDRRAAHRALAQATNLQSDPDRRAWHQAEACGGPDEAIAAELEQTAARAQARGGLAAAAAFRARAADLTPDPERRAERALAATAVMLPAGEATAAGRLLDTAEPGTVTPLVPAAAAEPGRADAAAAETAGPVGGHWRAHADLMRARLAVSRHQGGDGPRRLVDAARRLDRSDTGQIRAAYLDAIRATVFAAGLATPGGTVADVARAARKAPDPDCPGPPDLLLDGLAAYLSEEYAAGMPALREALSGFGSEPPKPDEPPSPERTADELRWLPLACMSALALWDDGAWDRLSDRFVRLARAQGALAELPLAFDLRAGLHLLEGDLATAESLAAEARAAASVTGARPTPYATLGLAALRGRRDPARSLIETAAEGAAGRGEGLGAAAAHWAAAVLHNGLGQYEEALAAAETAVGYAGPSVLACWPAAELIEAAVRAGRTDRATAVAEGLARSALVAGSDWALGIRARSLALLAGVGEAGAEGAAGDGADDAAEDLYQTAIGHLGKSRDQVGLARAHLLYGEWLRRGGRRIDAREQLRRAHQMLDAMGADGFAERARRELLATGETVRRRRTETERDLTAQELQIALRARNGQTNTEIGAELFLSPRTVEWHLRKVFTKLGITSRRELQQALRRP
jgi:DNA-binding CsgD family transcriptional regulator